MWHEHNIRYVRLTHWRCEASLCEREKSEHEHHEQPVSDTIPQHFGSIYAFAKASPIDNPSTSWAAHYHDVSRQKSSCKHERHSAACRMRFVTNRSLPSTHSPIPSKNDRPDYNKISCAARLRLGINLAVFFRSGFGCH